MLRQSTPSHVKLSRQFKSGWLTVYIDLRIYSVLSDEASLTLDEIDLVSHLMCRCSCQQCDCLDSYCEQTLEACAQQIMYIR